MRQEITSMDRRRIQANPAFYDLYEPYVFFFIKKFQASYRRNQTIRQVYKQRGYISKSMYHFISLPEDLALRKSLAVYEGQQVSSREQITKKLELRMLDMRVRNRPKRKKKKRVAGKYSDSSSDE
jgi:hypothetical protein